MDAGLRMRKWWMGKLLGQMIGVWLDWGEGLFYNLRSCFVSVF